MVGYLNSALSKSLCLLCRNCNGELCPRNVYRKILKQQGLKKNFHSKSYNSFFDCFIYSQPLIYFCELAFRFGSLFILYGTLPCLPLADNSIICRSNPSCRRNSSYDFFILLRRSRLQHCKFYHGHSRRQIRFVYCLYYGNTDIFNFSSDSFYYRMQAVGLT